MVFTSVVCLHYILTKDGNSSIRLRCYSYRIKNIHMMSSTKCGMCTFKTDKGCKGGFAVGPVTDDVVLFKDIISCINWNES